MKLAVTGATGFLGQYVCEHFHENGWDVVGLGRNEKKGVELQRAGIHFVAVDLRRKEEVIAALHDADIIVHSGALSEPWGAYEDFYDVNVRGTEHVISAAKAGACKRLIHISTPSLYFTYDSRIDVRESDSIATKFVNAYAETKHIAEKKMREAMDELEIIMLRPRALFGPRDTTILPRIIALNEKKGFPLPKKGEVLIDLTYIENVVHAIELAIGAPQQCVGEVYNITNGQPIPLSDALSKLFEAIDRPMKAKNIPYPLLKGIASLLEGFHSTFIPRREPILTKYTASVLGETQTLNIDKARTELGYEPPFSIEEGIERYAKWWKSNES